MKRLSRTPLLKGILHTVLKIKKCGKAQRKGKKVQRNGNLRISTREVEQGLIHPSSLGESSMSEALSAIKDEPGESRNLPSPEIDKG